MMATGCSTGSKCTSSAPNLTLADSDADWITDTLEVHGYPQGTTWYLNRSRRTPTATACRIAWSVRASLAPANMSAFDIGACDTDRDGTQTPST
jgi:hypothetical protein